MISFVIAAYNEENNLERCLKEVLETNLKFEVIIVDDGSTDSTYKVAKKIARNDERIVVLHQDNKGVSAARNNGIKHVSGDWVAFVDADDVIRKEFLSAFVPYMDTRTFPIMQGLQFTKRPNEESDNIYILETDYMQCVALNRKKYVANARKDYIDIYESIHGAVGKLFLVDFLKKNNLNFDEGLGLGEDLLFVVQALEHTGQILCIRKNVYQIILNPNSSTRRYNHKMIAYAPAFCEKILDFYEETNKGEQFFEDMCAQILLHIEVGITHNVLLAYPKLNRIEVDKIYNPIFKSRRIMNSLRELCKITRPDLIEVKKFIKWIPLYFLSKYELRRYLAVRRIGGWIFRIRTGIRNR